MALCASYRKQIVNKANCVFCAVTISEKLFLERKVASSSLFERFQDGSGKLTRRGYTRRG
jgi:hypothetical protein